MMMWSRCVAPKTLTTFRFSLLILVKRNYHCSAVICIWNMIVCCDTMYKYVRANWAQLNLIRCLRIVRIEYEEVMKEKEMSRANGWSETKPEFKLICKFACCLFSVCATQFDFIIIIIIAMCCSTTHCVRYVYVRISLYISFERTMYQLRAV